MLSTLQLVLKKKVFQKKKKGVGLFVPIKRGAVELQFDIVLD